MITLHNEQDSPLGSEQLLRSIHMSHSNKSKLASPSKTTGRSCLSMQSRLVNSLRLEDNSSNRGYNKGYVRRAYLDRMRVKGRWKNDYIRHLRPVYRNNSMEEDSHDEDSDDNMDN